MIQLSDIPEWRAEASEQEISDRLDLFNAWRRELLDNEIRARNPSTPEDWRTTVEAAFDKEDELRGLDKAFARETDEQMKDIWKTMRQADINRTLLDIMPPTP